jgi:hypothetical protein
MSSGGDVRFVPIGDKVRRSDKSLFDHLVGASSSMRPLALPPKADMVQPDHDVRLVPKADEVRRSARQALEAWSICGEYGNQAFRQKNITLAARRSER